MSAPLVVAAVGRRGAGERYAPRPVAELSAKAQALGLYTRRDVEAEYKAARQGWSVGTEWHCPFCNKDFGSVNGARGHMRRYLHPVLRVDYYAEEAGRAD